MLAPAVRLFQWVASLPECASATEVELGTELISLAFILGFPIASTKQSVDQQPQCLIDFIVQSSDNIKQLLFHRYQPKLVAEVLEVADMSQFTLNGNEIVQWCNASKSPYLLLFLGSCLDDMLNNSNFSVERTEIMISCCMSMNGNLLQTEQILEQVRMHC